MSFSSKITFPIILLSHNSWWASPMFLVIQSSFYLSVAAQLWKSLAQICCYHLWWQQKSARPGIGGCEETAWRFPKHHHVVIRTVYVIKWHFYNADFLTTQFYQASLAGGKYIMWVDLTKLYQLGFRFCQKSHSCVWILYLGLARSCAAVSHTGQAICWWSVRCH